MPDQDQARLFEVAEDLYSCLETSYFHDTTGRHHPVCQGDVILEDRLRTLSPKQRLAEAGELGFPYLVIIGKNVSGVLYVFLLVFSHSYSLSPGR